VGDRGAGSGVGRRPRPRPTFSSAGQVNPVLNPENTRCYSSSVILGNGALEQQYMISRREVLLYSYQD
jgi:hypothetical protein